MRFPLYTYSAGMRLRLGFFISTAMSPEILLIDEVIGTGDAEFQVKARARLDKMIEKTKIVMIASHNLNLLKNLCNRAIYLADGKLISFGDVEEVFDEYCSSLATGSRC